MAISNVFHYLTCRNINFLLLVRYIENEVETISTHHTTPNAP